MTKDLPIHIQTLYDNMGESLRTCGDELSYCMHLMNQAKLRSAPSATAFITVLKIYIFSLYTTISLSVFSRATFRAKNASEKRLNLKYIPFIAYEFNMAIFAKTPRKLVLWDKFKDLFTCEKDSSIFRIIDEIDELQSSLLSCIDKDNRDISLHYDNNLDKLYDYICSIQEDTEVQKEAKILLITNKLTLLCKVIIGTTNIDLESKIEESKEVLRFRESIKNSISFELTMSIDSIANKLDKNMQAYRSANNSMLRDFLNDESINRLKEFRDCLKLGILLHYFYIDLGAAINGYLNSEYLYEQNLNLIRINVIIYEGYSKIFRSKDKMQEIPSLWNKYIAEPITRYGAIEEKEEVTIVSNLLNEYSKDAYIGRLRHSYSHFDKRDDKSSIFKMWNEMFHLDPKTELNKALHFLDLLNRVIKLNQISSTIFAKEENQKTEQQQLLPLCQMFDKLEQKCKDESQKKQISTLKKKLMKKLLDSFHKNTKIS